jgi:hypothetical protein
MPDEASEEARELVRAQLEVLKPEDLGRELKAHERDLGALGATGVRYMGMWNRLTRSLENDIQHGQPSDLTRRLRSRIVKSPVLQLLVPMRAQLAGEPAGTSWRGRWDRIHGDDLATAAPQVRTFLHAHQRLLQADYLQAADGFERFSTTYPSSRILPLARYLEAESLYRVGFHREALCLVGQLDLGSPTPFLLNFDPVGVMWVSLHRHLPPSWVGAGPGVPSAGPTSLFFVDQPAQGLWNRWHVSFQINGSPTGPEVRIRER